MWRSQCGLGQRPAHFEDRCRRAPADGTTYTTIQQTSLTCWIVTLSTHIVLSALSGQCGHLERRHSAKRTTFLCVCQAGGPAQDAGTKPTPTCNRFNKAWEEPEPRVKIDSPAAHETPSDFVFVFAEVFIVRGVWRRVANWGRGIGTTGERDTSDQDIRALAEVFIAESDLLSPFKPATVSMSHTRGGRRGASRGVSLQGSRDGLPYAFILHGFAC